MPSALQPHDTRLCRSCAVTLLPKLYQGITMYHIIDITPATRAWEVETVRMTSIIDAHLRYLRERNCSPWSSADICDLHNAAAEWHQYFSTVSVMLFSAFLIASRSSSPKQSLPLQPTIRSPFCTTSLGCSLFHLEMSPDSTTSSITPPIEMFL